MKATRAAMQRIDVLLNRHRGQPAWIFGKGPSLDGFDFSQAGAVRICINESLRVVPEPTYFFAHDEPPIKYMSEAWPADCSAILQQVRAEYARSVGIPDSRLFVYTKCYCDNHVRDMHAEQMAELAKLYGNSGTVHCAIHFCRLIGARRVTLVGFDGTGGYARCIGLPDGGAEHDRIRRDSMSLLAAMGMQYTFFPH